MSIRKFLLIFAPKFKTKQIMATGNYTYQRRIPHRDNWNLYNNAVPTKRYEKTTFFDNPISLGEGVAWSPRVRVPKLCRKTAWKRFYKLYPHLKGRKVMHGRSSCMFHGLNESTIKLKG